MSANDIGPFIAREITALKARAYADEVLIYDLRTRAEAAEAALKDVAKAWFDLDQEALDTLLGPYREEEA